MFKIGDLVVDHNGRVYTIDHIEEKNFGNGNAKYFVLIPRFKYDFSEGYVGFIPYDKADELLRYILTEEEANKVIDNFRDDKTEPFKDPKTRRDIYTIALKTGKTEDVVIAYKTLLQSKRERELASRKFSEFEKGMLKTISNLFISELSLSLDESDFSTIEKRLLLNFYK